MRGIGADRQIIRKWKPGESKVWDCETGKTNQVEDWVIRCAFELNQTVEQYLKTH